TKGDFGYMLLGWGTESDEQGSAMRSLLATRDPDKGMGVNNRGRYSNPAFDKQLTDALFTMDDNKRDVLLQQAAETVMNDTGLDKPVLKQFGLFVVRGAQGDLGRSFVYNIPAIQLIVDKLPATLELAGVAMVIAIILGIPLGLLAGLKPHSLAGRAIMASSILGFSLPTFWVGLVLIMV